MADFLDTDHFETRTADLKAQIGTVKGTMEVLCRTFVAAAERFLTQWLQDEIKRARDTYPDVILSIPLDQLHLLKEELKILAGNFSDHVSSALNNERVWSHRIEPFHSTDNPPNRYAFVRGRPPQEMDRLIRGLMGQLGAILLKYQLGNGANDLRWDVQVYPPRFAGPLEWPDTMTMALERFSGMHEKLTRLYDFASDIIHKRQQILAAARWEEA